MTPSAASLQPWFICLSVAPFVSIPLMLLRHRPRLGRSVVDEAEYRPPRQATYLQMVSLSFAGLIALSVLSSVDRTPYTLAIGEFVGALAAYLTAFTFLDNFGSRLWSIICDSALSSVGMMSLLLGVAAVVANADAQVVWFFIIAGVGSVFVNIVISDVFLWKLLLAMPDRISTEPDATEHSMTDDDAGKVSNKAATSTGEKGLPWVTCPKCAQKYLPGNACPVCSKARNLKK